MMKITNDTIYGNLGYIVRHLGNMYLIRDYSWDRREYLLESVAGRQFWVLDHKLIGDEIIDDKWELMKNGEI